MTTRTNASKSAQAELDSVFSLRSPLMRPDYLSHSAWIEHVPFAFWLVEALRPRTVVELGTHYGVSYFAFCQAVERLGLPTSCYAVDTWKGDEHSGFYSEEVFRLVREHNATKYSSFSSLIRSTFDEALHHFLDGSIDILHIDGHHTEESVSRDFESWQPKLSKQAVVLFHDINVRERDFGVSLVFERLSANNRSFSFAHGHGLGVLGLGDRSAPPVDALFKLNENDVGRQSIQEFFGRMGQACSDSRDLRTLRTKLAETEKDLASARKQADDQKTAAEKAKTDLSNRTRELSEERARLESAKIQATREEGENRTQSSMLLDRSSRMENELLQARQEIRALLDRLADARVDAATTTGRLQVMEMHSTELQRSLELIKTELVGAQRQSEALAGERYQLEKARDELTDQLRTLRGEREALTGRLSSMQTALDAAEASFATARSEAAAAVAERDRIAEEHGVLRQKHVGIMESLERSESAIQSSRDASNQLKSELTAEVGKRKQLEADVMRLNADIATRFNELARLTQIAHTAQKVAESQESELRKRSNQIEGYAERLALAQSASVWSRLVKQDTLTSAQVRKLIEKSGLFSASWYLERYPDVATSGQGALDHYMRYGWREGRDPSPKFSTSAYLSANPDVAQAGTNPLGHYVVSGKLEGRSIASS
jgi:predicted  nucleic acid-binding Zn-ribbon protein